MFKRIDESPLLVRLLARFSAFLSKNKGLPVVVGIALIVVATILQVINVSANSATLELFQIVIQAVGLLLALIGLLLAEPLGK